jgi:holin-like protein
MVYLTPDIPVATIAATMIYAIAVLLSCQLAGEALVRLTGLPVPGPIVGLILLLAALLILRRCPAVLETTSLGLLQHLSLLFVPAGVGIIRHLDRLQAEWLAIGVALVASTVLTLAVTAVVFRLTSRLVGDPDGG